LPGIKSDQDIAAFAHAATFTRLHLRYTKESLSDDLVFKAAEAIVGGIPEVAKTGPAKNNRFQGRYIIRHPFDVNQCYRYYGGGIANGPVMPMGFNATLAGQSGNKAAQGALKEPVESFIVGDVAELGMKGTAAPAKKK